MEHIFHFETVAIICQCGLQEQLVSLLGLFVELRRLVEVQFRRAIVPHVEILLPRFNSCT